MRCNIRQYTIITLYLVFINLALLVIHHTHPSYGPYPFAPISRYTTIIWCCVWMKHKHYRNKTVALVDIVLAICGQQAVNDAQVAIKSALLFTQTSLHFHIIFDLNQQQLVQFNNTINSYINIMIKHKR
jgi:hypothetical protein